MIIGIDPGQSGAVAIIGKTASVYDYTTPADLAQVLVRHVRIDPWNIHACHAYIEKVGAMPKNGAVSMFKFGRNVGEWYGMLAALGIPFTEVTPQAWKKHHGLIRKDKNASITRACQLFPQLADQMTRAKDDGRAEALLIADYGRSIRALTLPSPVAV